MIVILHKYGTRAKATVCETMTDMGHRRLIDRHGKVVLVYRYIPVTSLPPAPATPRDHAIAAARYTHTPLVGDYKCEALLEQDGALVWSGWDNFKFSPGL